MYGELKALEARIEKIENFLTKHEEHAIDTSDLETEIKDILRLDLKVHVRSLVEVD